MTLLLVEQFMDWFLVEVDDQGEGKKKRRSDMERVLEIGHGNALLTSEYGIAPSRFIFWAPPLDF